MTKKSTPNGKGKFSPEIISRFKKERFIRSMSEDEFRDKVVRPLFLRKQFKDGRDLCGPQEEGKDTIFVEMNRLGFPVLYAVQTKKGNLKKSDKCHKMSAAVNLSMNRRGM